MILIGQYDSPFVRRVGIALRLYGLPFEHRLWSTFADAQKVQEFNPLMRVPVLVLDNGDALIESAAILDYLDGQVPPGQRLYPQTEPDRHRAIRIASLAAGLSDKVISLFYEKVLHKEVSEAWVARCLSQISATLAALEAERAGLASTWLFGEQIGHADIMIGTSLRHMSDAHPGLLEWEKYPALAAHCARLETMPVFQEISQPFIAPS